MVDRVPSVPIVSTVASTAPPDGRGIAGSGLVYIVATLLQRLAAFVTLPLVASITGPSRFGEISLAVSIGLIATYALPLGQDILVTRELSSGSDRAAHARAIKSSSRALLVGVVLGLVGAGVLAAIYAGARALFLLEISSTVVIAGATALPLATWRVRRQVRPVATLLLTITAFQAGGRLALIALFDGHTWAWGLGSALGALVAVLGTVRWHLQNARGPVPAHSVRTSLKSGIGLVPHQLAGWGLSSLDRVVLAGLVTNALLGIYSLTYQILAVLGVVFAEINRAFMPSYGRASPDEAVKKMARVQAWITVSLGGAALTASPLILTVVLPRSFAAGDRLAAPLLIAMMELGLYYPCANVITLRLARPGRIAMATGLSVVANVVLLLITVPDRGLLAAAWATTVAYALLFLIAFSMCPPALRRPFIGPLAALSALLIVAVADGIANLEPWVIPFAGATAFMMASVLLYREWGRGRA